MAKRILTGALLVLVSVTSVVTPTTRAVFAEMVAVGAMP